jgi:dephospho-CoA kinase
MIRIALTGSIGMGKSTVAGMFAARGVPVFDADAVVRRLQTEDAALIAAIGQRFEGTVADGVLDRDALAARVLGRPEELAALEAVVHPAVHAERARFLLANQDAPLLVFDIPLLFETGGDEAFDKVVVVSAPAAVQRQRVLARPGMNEAKLAAILARQLPDAEKRHRADFVIDTGADLSTTDARVGEILTCLGLPASG